MNGPRVILKDANITARIRAARVAIAVERFRLAHDQLPQSLAELGSSGVGALPADPFDGQPLRYKTAPDADTPSTAWARTAPMTAGTG